MGGGSFAAATAKRGGTTARGALRSRVKREWMLAERRHAAAGEEHGTNQKPESSGSVSCRVSLLCSLSFASTDSDSSFIYG